MKKLTAFVSAFALLMLSCSQQQPSQPENPVLPGATQTFTYEYTHTPSFTATPHETVTSSATISCTHSRTATYTSTPTYTNTPTSTNTPLPECVLLEQARLNTNEEGAELCTVSFFVTPDTGFITRTRQCPDDFFSVDFYGMNERVRIRLKNIACSGPVTITQWSNCSYLEIREIYTGYGPEFEKIFDIPANMYSFYQNCPSGGYSYDIAFDIVTLTPGPTATVTPTATPTYSSGPDAYEPGDNTHSGATSIFAGDTQVHNTFDPNDIDWYLYESPDGNNAVFYIRTTGLNSAQIIHYDASLNQIDSFSIQTSETEGWISMTGLSAGQKRYFSFTQNLTGNNSFYEAMLVVPPTPTHTATLTATPTCVVSSDDAYEDTDDTYTGATLLEPDIPQFHTSVGTDDQDWFYFNVSEDEFITIVIERTVFMPLEAEFYHSATGMSSPVYSISETSDNYYFNFVNTNGSGIIYLKLLHSGAVSGCGLYYYITRGAP